MKVNWRDKIHVYQDFLPSVKKKKLCVKKIKLRKLKVHELFAIWSSIILQKGFVISLNFNMK